MKAFIDGYWQDGFSMESVRPYIVFVYPLDWFIYQEFVTGDEFGKAIAFSIDHDVINNEVLEDSALSAKSSSRYGYRIIISKQRSGLLLRMNYAERHKGDAVVIPVMGYVIRSFNDSVLRLAHHKSRQNMKKVSLKFRYDYGSLMGFKMK